MLKRRAHKRFIDEGWTLLRGLLAPRTCADPKTIFREEVAGHTGPLMRQLTSLHEPHERSADGYMTNPVANPHRCPQFPRFCTLEQQVMRATPLVQVVEALLGAPPVMLQSAYYESSKGTHTHLDFDPLDRSRPMVGVWIALEAIRETAGRFYPYPHSHTLPDDARMATFSELAWSNYRSAFVELDPRTAEDEAQRLLASILDDHDLHRETPALEVGDTLFWSNRILHGSHVPKPGGGSRHSLLLHFVELELAQTHQLALSRPGEPASVTD